MSVLELGNNSKATDQKSGFFFHVKTYLDHMDPFIRTSGAYP
jgi:hypothetical protein